MLIEKYCNFKLCNLFTTCSHLGSTYSYIFATVKKWLLKCSTIWGNIPSNVPLNWFIQPFSKIYLGTFEKWWNIQGIFLTTKILCFFFQSFLVKHFFLNYFKMVEHFKMMEHLYQNVPLFQGICLQIEGNIAYLFRRFNQK